MGKLAVAKKTLIGLGLAVSGLLFRRDSFFFFSFFRKVGRNDKRATGLLPVGPDLGDAPRAEPKLRGFNAHLPARSAACQSVGLVCSSLRKRGIFRTEGGTDWSRTRDSRR